MPCNVSTLHGSANELLELSRVVPQHIGGLGGSQHQARLNCHPQRRVPTVPIALALPLGSGDLRGLGRGRGAGGP
eukprot:scaffold1798_cov376-Prasinococcus_capsulatus_cf.AAC.8